MKKANILFVTAVAFIFLITTGCMDRSEKNDQVSKSEYKVEPGKNSELNAIFPKGELGPAQNFTGNAWAAGLLANDSTYNTLVGNVYFEPGARSNWHIHPPGQILIITDGVGFHQIKGQPKQTIRKGDVVKCPPNTEHWHGASPDTGMQQLYIIPKTEKGIVTWLGKVTDDVYNGK